MEKINWSPEYNVGVGIFDEQHKRLVLMLNRLIGSKETTTGSELISDLITLMTMYAQEHFKAEEDLMAEFGFPLLDQHKHSHVKFRKKVVDICMAVPLGVPVVPQVVLNFLVQWWQNHILHEDMAYKSFFKEKGIY
ncbi:MAG: bacteriohemerythrin [Desulfobacteraceae bacterium]|jgi:hemerythrin-like metal-binding protein